MEAQDEELALKEIFQNDFSQIESGAWGARQFLILGTEIIS